MSPLRTPDEVSVRNGVLLGLSAYLVWGFFPAFFKSVAHIPPLEVACHRIVWSLATLVPLALLTRRQGEILAALRTPRVLATLACSTLLIASNWVIFIYAVESGQVLLSSLGYFINPLVSVLLGFVFLKERLQRWQNLSLLLAIGGVATMTLLQGRLPWIALVLAITFGTYGLLRKQVSVDALVGLSVETLLLTPLALAYLLRPASGTPFWGSLPLDPVLLPLSGVVTAIPLLLFAAAARRLRLATIGFMQYLTPTLHFLIAVALFGETFTPSHAAGFGLIWLALTVYTAATLRGPSRPSIPGPQKHGPPQPKPHTKKIA